MVAKSKTETKMEASSETTARTGVGFRGFAKPAKIDQEEIKARSDSPNDADLYVFYTGGSYRARRASGRFASLSSVKEVRKPVSIIEVYKRAANAAGEGKGYAPSLVRGGLFLHAGARPCVYLPLLKDAEGNYRLAKDIPTPDPSLSDKPLKENTVIVSAKGQLQLAAPKAK